MEKSKQNLELEAIAGRIRPRNDKNVRPGDRMGLTPEEVRNYIKRQKRCQGEKYDLSTGDNPGLQVQLPGTARVWLGFSVLFTGVAGGVPPLGDMTLLINNEVVIDDVQVQFYSADFTDEEYFFLPRPLSGQDDIEFTIKGVQDPYTIHIVNYYL